MALAAHLVRELLTMLKADSARRRGTDKRATQRVGLREPTHILGVNAVAHPEPIRCWVRNLSAGGIGLLARHALERGDEFVVEFKRPTGEAPLRLLYRTTQGTRVAAGLYSIGARLVCVVEEIRRAG